MATMNASTIPMITLCKKKTKQMIALPLLFEN